MSEQKVSFFKTKHVHLRERNLQNRWSNAKIHFTLINIQENLFPFVT